MPDFDQRWHTITSATRPLWHEAAGELPFGFATRVLAQWRRAPAESWEDLLFAIGRRAMIAAIAICLASAGFAYFQWYETRIEPPALERAVNPEAWLP